jgi:starch synthase
MAAGTPVVSTRCGGPEEIVIDQGTGLLVPRQDVASLARAIEHILGNPADAARMSQAGRSRIDEHFTLDAHAEHVQSVIAEVVRNYAFTQLHK